MILRLHKRQVVLGPGFGQETIGYMLVLQLAEIGYMLVLRQAEIDYMLVLKGLRILAQAGYKMQLVQVQELALAQGPEQELHCTKEKNRHLNLLLSRQ